MIELVHRSLDGVLETEEAQELNGLLERDPGARRLYLEILINVAAFGRYKGISGVVVAGKDDGVSIGKAVFQNVVKRDSVDSAVRRAIDAVNEVESPGPVAKKSASARSPLTGKAFMRGMAKIAAVLLLAVTIIWLDRKLWQSVNQPSPQVPVVAKLTEILNAKWADSYLPVDVGSDLKAGSMVLDEGVVQIRFNSGAKIIIEAPAEITLTTANRVRLDAGTLTATVPEAARGFEVETPSGRVTDLGTEFGLMVNIKGVTEVHVLDGVVEAGLVGAEKGDLHGIRTLYQDEAILLDMQNNSMRNITCNPDRFASSWEDVYYKVKMSGGVRQVFDFPFSLRKNAFEDNQVLVFLERKQVTLPSDVAVNINSAGAHQKFGKIQGVLPAGMRVDSYVIHLDPKSKGYRKQWGTIEFNRPIVGVITDTDQLILTDSILGAHGTLYEKDSLGGRGLEAKVSKTGGDQLMIDEDRRTLKFNLDCRMVDQIRVLIQH